MNDVVLEWIVPYFMPVKKRLLKAVLLSAAVVLIADGILFYPVILLPAVVLAAVDFFLFRSWKLEFEYSYVNGDLTISKIIHKEKRKDVFHCERKEIQWVQKGRVPTEHAKPKDFSSGWEKASVYTLKTADRTVYIEPNEEFLQEMTIYRKVKQ
ncbi:MAG TPA: hypothetical protein IAA07_06915 [Candidatus Lachnoclostridium stercoravium]|uniref:Uncharacterized protein n=1 Tax=Candidatus Lachnoclostridium stercoravium TaxID=2838633 RepID=A0A9D2HIB2_9FIRM|nr:hypothetical protein [Candidatus Lachnoclostridium stercoravium]